MYIQNRLYILWCSCGSVNLISESCIFQWGKIVYACGDIIHRYRLYNFSIILGIVIITTIIAGQEYWIYTTRNYIE